MFSLEWFHCPRKLSGVGRSIPVSPCYREGTLVAWGWLKLFSRDGGCRLQPLSPPKNFSALCRATSNERWSSCAEHSKSKGVNLENNLQSYVWVPCLRDGWPCVGLSVTAPSGIPGDLQLYLALPSIEALPGGPYIFPLREQISVQGELVSRGLQ